MEDLLTHLRASGLNPVVIDENTIFPRPIVKTATTPDFDSGSAGSNPAGPASPFLPGTNIQYAWDSTMLSSLKTCPRLYQYQYIDGWSSEEESVHLRFGIEYHQALHDYELGKAADMSHEDALLDAVWLLTQRLVTYPKIDLGSKPSIRNKTRWNLIRTVVWYLDKFEDDNAETVMLADGKPAMEVSFKFELDWGPTGFGPHQDLAELTGSSHYILCGHLDRIVTFNSATFVMDRKTTTSTPGDYYFAQFEPNNQMTLYTLAGEIVLGAPVKGVIIDAAAVQVNASQFQRGMTYRTKAQLNEWLESLRVLLAQAESYATANFWPMNDTACDKFGGCRFREICNKSPHVRTAFLRANFKQLPKEERWNPLKPR